MHNGADSFNLSNEPVAGRKKLPLVNKTSLIVSNMVGEVTDKLHHNLHETSESGLSLSTVSTVLSSEKGKGAKSAGWK